jgi:hypothetical protein
LLYVLAAAAAGLFSLAALKPEVGLSGASAK